MAVTRGYASGVPSPESPSVFAAALAPAVATDCTENALPDNETAVDAVAGAHELDNNEMENAKNIAARMNKPNSKLCKPEPNGKTTYTYAPGFLSHDFANAHTAGNRDILGDYWAASDSSRSYVWETVFFIFHFGSMV